MSEDKIEKHVKSYYSSQTLDPKIMARLKSMSEASVETEETTTIFNRWPMMKMGIAASFLMFTVVTTQVLFNTYSHNTGDLVMRIAQEVELNHNKQFKSDFLSTNVQTLASVMHKLDFDLKLPARLINAGYEIIGARYCSIQGGIAAQLKLIDSAGKTSTLYVTKLNDLLVEISQQSQSHDGLTIDLWQDESLFYSLAQPQ